VNKLLRREKRMAEIEKYRGNPRELYKYCKAIKTGYVSKIQFMENRNVDLVSTPEQIAKEFKGYFKELLNSKPNNEGGNVENIMYYTVEPEEHRIGKKYR